MPHCTAVGLHTVYPEKHENSTAWDNAREEQSNVFVQIVHALDVYIVVCMQRSATCFYFLALRKDEEKSD